MPIDATNGLLGAWCRRRSTPAGCCCRSRASRVGVGLLLEADDLARDRRTGRCPSASRRRRRHGLRGDGDVGVALDVRLDQLAEVHPVEVIAGEDQVVVGVEALEVARGLAHGVGGALEPVRAVGRLLGGEDFDEALREHVEPVGLRDVAVERRRVELRQHEDPLEVGVQAVADRDVDQPVLAAERHRRLRAHVGQREEARAAAAAENQGQDVVHVVNILSRFSSWPRLTCVTTHVHREPWPSARSAWFDVM